MSFSLQDRRALVTGGNRGIGSAIVRRLAQEGVHVALTYASNREAAEATAQAARSFGVETIAICADSADSDALIAAVDHTIRAFGGIDILVNNAGVALMAPIDDYPLADFDRTLAINVRAVFVATQAAVRHMDRRGRVINIGSTNADRMPFPGGAVYAMSKAALKGLVQGLARDLGPRGITVNNVQPGPIDTGMNPSTGEFSELLKSFMALPRCGEASEVAALVAYLASSEAGYITGASLTIDGGFSA